MSETVTQDSKPSYGVTFSKKISDGNFGGEEVSFWVSADVPAGADLATTEKALSNAAYIAKALTFQELGLEFEIRNGILFATTASKRQDAAPQRRTHTETSVANDTVAAAFPGSTELRVKGKQNGELPAWLIEAAAKAGVTEVYDNRDSVAGTNRPHFKATTGGNNAKGFWPPKS